MAILCAVFGVLSIDPNSRLTLPPLPRIIGHRGACAHAPENTLASIRKAAALGARWVEFDVRLTADGRLAVIHDETVDRTTDGHGRVADMTLSDLRRFDAGRWFGAIFAGERVPSLEEAIALLAELDIGANIEIKANAADAADTAATLGRVLARAWPRDRPAPLVSSFELTALEAMQAVAPQWPRGLLMKKLGASWRTALTRVGAATLNLDQRPIDAAAMAEARTAGIPILLYTVNDPERARALLSWGAAAVFTDRPEIAAVLAAA